MSERLPKAFISTSLREEDKQFCELVESIVKENNFEPAGTVGKYSQSPEPLMHHIMANIQNSDCVVMVATPRYIQQDYHDPTKTTLGISDIVQTEGVIAKVFGKPVLIFAEEGVNLNSFFKNITEYIVLKPDGSDINEKSQIINDYFNNTLRIINENKNLAKPVKPKLTGVFQGEKSLFIGRKTEITELSKILLDNTKKSPISVVGTGGIGKSSLVYKVIHSSELSFDFILAIVGEKNLSFRSFLQRVGNYFAFIQGAESETDISRYKTTLLQSIAGLGKTIFFFDNFDLVDAPEIHTFLEELPTNVKVVITSRNKTNLTGEQIYEIDGLETEDGIKLFVEITKKFFKNPPSSEFVTKLKDLIISIESHPLSIKLLAGSYKGGGTSELLHISSNLMHLINQYEEGTGRSVNACLNYSYSKLSKKQKKGLELLTIFISPFSQEAAKEIVNIKQEELYDLYDKSFIRRFEIENANLTTENIFLYDMHPVVRKFIESKNVQSLKDLESKLSKYYYNFIVRAYDNIGISDKHHHYYGIVNVIFRKRHNDIDTAMNNVQNLRERSFMCNKLAQILHNVGSPNLAFQYYLKNLDYDIQDKSPVRVGNDYRNIGLTYENDNEYGIALVYHIMSKDNYQKGKDQVRVLDAELNIISCLINLRRSEIAYRTLKKMYGVVKSLEHKIPSKQYNLTLVSFFSTFAGYFASKKNHICRLACYQKMTSHIIELGDQYVLGDHYILMALACAKFNDISTEIGNLRLAYTTYQKIGALEHMYACCITLAKLYRTVDLNESRKFQDLSQNIRKNPNFDEKKKILPHFMRGRGRF